MWNSSRYCTWSFGFPYFFNDIYLLESKIVSYSDDTDLLFIGNNWNEALSNIELGLKEVKL